jgi:hypothetical protein
MERQVKTRQSDLHLPRVNAEGKPNPWSDLSACEQRSANQRPLPLIFLWEGSTMCLQIQTENAAIRLERESPSDSKNFKPCCPLRRG